MAEGALGGDDVAACGDQPGSVEVPKVVETDVRCVGLSSGRTPEPGAAIVVPRLGAVVEMLSVRFAGRNMARDAVVEPGDQLVGDVEVRSERYSADGSSRLCPTRRHSR